jgi:hypothetical protein
MNYAYVCEFAEIISEFRSARLQGGGVHGNAILSRYTLQQCRTIKHTRQFDWESYGEAFLQPRLGDRVALSALVDIPSFGEQKTTIDSVNKLLTSLLLLRRFICRSLLVYM